MCRATYLGRRNIIVLLLKHDADINKRSFDGRTSLHWAAFRNNTQILELLVSNDADITLEDKDGFNALDLAITRINYSAAYYLVSETDLKPKSIQEYEGKTWRKMDT
jgi:ankyrin repeat protein